MKISRKNWLVYLRIFIGIGWFGSGLSKIIMGQAKLIETITFFASQNSITWYSNFLDGVVMPNLILFAYLLTIGEVLVGVSLALGVLTNVGCFFGIFMNVNYALVVVGAVTFVVLPNLIMIVLQLMLLLSPRSKMFSLDKKIAEKISWFNPR